MIEVYLSYPWEVGIGASFGETKNTESLLEISIRRQRPSEHYLVAFLT